MVQIGFIIEQALGHITHARNLQACVPGDPAVEAHWGLVPFEAQGLSARVPVFRSNWTVRAGLRARRMVASLTRQVRLDALFFHTQVPAVLMTDWLRRIPSIVSLDATPQQYDSLGAFYAHERGPAWLERLKWRLNRDCFRAARHLVAWSEWAKQGLIDGYQVPAGKVSVIPPGVNPAEWYRPTPRAEAPSSDGVRAGEPVKILFVGGNLERKGGLVLLDAWRALKQEMPGEGARGATVGLELHLVTRDRVSPEPGLSVYNDLQPNSEPLKRLYHTCDVFCLPTYGDCLPMVLSEAGAAALPCISTRVAAIPEIVREGETGLLVPPGDPEALAQALRRLVTNPALRQQMGQRAERVVSAGFDAQRNTMRLLQLLKWAAGPRARAAQEPVLP